MHPIPFFVYWLGCTHGFMWIKRGKRERLHCNWISAGVAALLDPILVIAWYLILRGLAESLYGGLEPLFMDKESGLIAKIVFVFLFFLVVFKGIVIVYLCHWFLPSFRVKNGTILECALLYWYRQFLAGLLAALLSSVIGWILFLAYLSGRYRYPSYMRF